MSKATACSGRVGLFRFYNWKVSGYGEPFALCEGHEKEQVVPDTCRLEKLSETALKRPCSVAVERELEEAAARYREHEV